MLIHTSQLQLHNTYISNSSKSTFQISNQKYNFLKLIIQFHISISQSHTTTTPIFKVKNHNPPKLQLYKKNNNNPIKLPSKPTSLTIKTQKLHTKEHVIKLHKTFPKTKQKIKNLNLFSPSNEDGFFLKVPRINHSILFLQPILATLRLRNTIVYTPRVQQIFLRRRAIEQVSPRIN